MCDACDRYPETNIISELDKAHPIVKAHFDMLKQSRDALFNIAWLPEESVRYALTVQGVPDSIATSWLTTVRAVATNPESPRPEYYDPNKDLYRGAVVEAFWTAQESMYKAKGWMTPTGELNYYQMAQDGIPDNRSLDDLPPLD